jgi:hypothetical protein
MSQLSVTPAHVSRSSAQLTERNFSCCTNRAFDTSKGQLGMWPVPTKAQLDKKVQKRMIDK